MSCSELFIVTADASSRNSTFVKDAHRALLAEDTVTVGECNGVNMLPYVLLPLCGPEEFDIDVSFLGISIIAHTA